MIVVSNVLFFQIRQKIVEVLEWQNIGKTEMSLGGGGGGRVCNMKSVASPK